MAPAASPDKRSASPSKKSQQASQGDKKPAKPKKEEKPAGKDIRNFFSQPSSSSASARTAANGKAGSGKQPITIDDSDEDEQTLRADAPSKATTSKHFAAKAPASSMTIDVDDTPSPPTAKPSASSKPSGSSPRTSKAAPPAKGKTDSKPAMPAKRPAEDQPDDRQGAKRQSIGSSRAKKVNHIQSDSSEEEEEVEVRPRAKTASTSKAKWKKDDTFMDVDDEDDNDDLDHDDEDEDDIPKKSKAKSSAKPPAKKPTPKSTPKKAASSAKNGSTKKAEAAKPAAKKEDADEEKPKPKPANNWYAMKQARAAGPSAPGSKEIPEGAPNCLEGLTFVFTGELESLGRDDAIELAKRYSGRVTSAPSKVTSFVVVGENAGASKLKAIAEKNIPTMNEDEFLDLIRTRSGGQLNEKQAEAKAKEVKKIEEQAKMMEAREKEEEKLRKRREGALKGTGLPAKKSIPLSAQLWTTKYAPQTMKEICGNKAPVERLLTWLQAWDANYKSGFKKPGKDGMGIFRAVLISGPPGIGKTTSAHLAAKQAGYSPIELNASDTRSKKLVENSTNIDNASLDGFFSGKGIQATTVADVRIESKTCLIMDEVDGMSAGDRGGVGALNTLIKKTRIPLVLICNDRTLQKMKPLQHTTFNMTFRRPGPAEIRSRVMSILFKEKLKIPSNVVDELIAGCNSDIRQVLNMLSTFKLSKAEMTFDEGKELLKINEKNTVMTPFAIIDKLTSPYAFSRTNKESLNDKSDLYFHDFSFVPLFMQEHYAKTQPVRTNNSDEREKTLKHLELLSKASDCISDGDLIDRMIHGSEQHWSLLPLHAIQSTVAPASFIYGPMRSGSGAWGPSFPQWLGQNSKQTKLQRLLTDIQIRMRLRVSGGKHEIREQYMPLLASKIVLPLKEDGSEAIDGVIGTMDEYYLGKDDWDAFVELGVGEMNGDALMKGIPSATKSAFTRQYNKADHPIAFHKGDMFASAKRKIADQGPPPDNEDVFEEDEPAPDEDDNNDKAEESGEENDVSKDKLIKAVKPKGKKGVKEETSAKGKKNKK